MEAIGLQAHFATAPGEAAWNNALYTLIQQEHFEEAQAAVVGALQQTPSELSNIALATTAESVFITGWEDIISSLKDYEGDPITALGITLFNDFETALEKQLPFEPGVDLRFYTDESFPFSTATRPEILAENTGIYTSWSDKDEDIETYLEIEGLAELNAALLNHRHRVFLRGETGDTPPFPSQEYIAYVMACWMRILRFHQAVRAQLDQHGLPNNIMVVVATHNIKPFVGGASYAKKIVANRNAERAPLTIKRVAIDSQADKPMAMSGSDLRRKTAEPVDLVETVEADQPALEAKSGFFARLFRRRNAA